MTNQAPASASLYPPPGSISTGSLRAADLGPRLASALERYAPELAHNPGDPEVSFTGVDWEDPANAGLLGDLFDALDSISPPGHLFAAHPGDGADFGWWPAEAYGQADASPGASADPVA